VSKRSDAFTPPSGQPPVPPGQVLVPVRTTYLQMLRNEAPELPAPPPGCTVARWRRPQADAYRSLFSAVGGEWGWTGRLLIGEAELRALLDDHLIEIYRLRHGSRIAGFVELDRRVPGQVEIVYFGLTPEFIGRGLGGLFLRWAIHRAWRGGGRGGRPATERVWLHTCDYDHPSALAVYRKAGFLVYDEWVELEPYPEAHLARLARPHDEKGRTGA
jgi:GNAT superfamily N-acetyltransferase